MCKNNFRRSAGLSLALFFLLASLNALSNVNEAFKNPLNVINIPDEITVNIDTANYRKYKLSVLRGFFDESSNISEKYKKEVNGEIKITFNSKESSIIRAKIRMTGDYTDHIRIKDVVSSLYIKLLNGNISGITRFKLLLPGTRNSHHEVFTTVLFEKLGIIAPYTKIVTVNINGYETPMLFQEVPEKELLERFSLREAPILEGDERQYYTNYINKSGRSLCCTARLDNSKWLHDESIIRHNIVQNGLSLFTSIVLKGDEDIHNSDHHNFVLEDKSFREIMLFLNASHGLSAHNRKFYFDPIYNVLLPIYYDGDPELTSNTRLNPQNLSENFRSIILNDNFISDVMDEYFVRAGPVDEKSLDYLQNLEGKRILRPQEMREILEKLVDSVKNIKINLVNGKPKEYFLPLSIDSLSKLNQVLLDQFDKSTPYIFVTTDIDSGKPLMCHKKTNLTNYKFKDFELINNFKVNCNEIDKKLYTKALKGSLSYKISDRPYKIHVQTPGLMYSDEVNANYFDNEYLKKVIKNNNLIKENMTGFEGNHIINSDSILFPEQKFSSKIFFYIYKNIPEMEKIVVEKNETHFIFFEDDQNTLNKSTLNLTLMNSENENGRVVLLGNLSSINKIQAQGLGKKLPSESISQYDVFDDRLLTGCITILDAKVNDMRIETQDLNCEDSINFLRSSGRNLDVVINNSKFDAVDVDFSNIKFNNIQINNAGNDCIDFSAGHYQVSQANVMGCGDKGISVGEKSNLEVHNLVVYNTLIGVASKDDSIAIIDNATINNTETCFSAYNKKSEFGGGLIKYKNLNISCSDKIYFDEKSSILKLND